LQGGFESSTVINPAGGTTAQANVCNWKSGSSFAAGTGVVRSGSKSAHYQNQTFTGSLTILTPLVTVPATTGQFVLQYYVRAPNALQKRDGLQRNSGTAELSGSFTNSTGAWQKKSFVAPGTASATSVNGRLLLELNGNSYQSVYYDDVTIYEGSAVDNAAPNAPTGVGTVSIAAGRQTVSWTAPVAGVDGGGYLVVRSVSATASSPYVNGIYETGNAIGAGIVAYVGTSTTFIDSLLLSDGTSDCINRNQEHVRFFYNNII
jgi:hypothetical protein